MDKAVETLADEYRRAPVRHADETGWRTDGKNGYAWLFATPNLSLFRFRGTRSAIVPAEVLGKKPLSGVLVVDRYHAYNHAPVALQYCYSHRVYHWARDPAIPAENNLAERDLRPLVVARKVSFGSQSEAGARTRETLMSVLHTLKRRRAPVANTLQAALDRLVDNPAASPYDLLFANAPHTSRASPA